MGKFQSPSKFANCFPHTGTHVQREQPVCHTSWFSPLPLRNREQQCADPIEGLCTLNKRAAGVIIAWHLRMITSTCSTAKKSFPELGFLGPLALNMWMSPGLPATSPLHIMVCLLCCNGGTCPLIHQCFRAMDFRK